MTPPVAMVRIGYDYRMSFRIQGPRKQALDVPGPERSPVPKNTKSTSKNTSPLVSSEGRIFPVPKNTWYFLALGSFPVSKNTRLAVFFDTGLPVPKKTISVTKNTKSF